MLAYVLNIGEEEAEALDSGNSVLSAEQKAALDQLERFLAEVFQRRSRNNVLQPQDAGLITDFGFRNGRSIFTELRTDLGGTIHGQSSGDDVQKAIARMCEECFPFTLLPVPRAQYHFGRMDLPRFSRTPLLEDFMTAVRSDGSLMKLFPDGAPDEFSCSPLIVSSFGRGSSVQLCLLHELLIRAGTAVMHARGKSSASDLRSATFEMLAALRKLAEGEDVELPVIETFDLLGLPECAEIPVRDGRLVGIPREFVRHMPDYARPEMNEGAVFGCMLDRIATFSIKLVAPGEEDETADWPVNVTRERAGRDKLVSLATGLALDGEPFATARWRSTITIDPIHGVNPRGSSSGGHSRHHRHHVATEEECQRLEEVARALESVDFSRVEIAASRFLKAVIGRAGAEDSLIDAVIGLESLFGGRAEIAFSMASGVSNLLGKDRAEREQIFAEIKTIYNARSDVVHGRAPKQRDDVRSLRAAALYYLKRCLVELLETRPELLELDTACRVRTLVLGDK